MEQRVQAIHNETDNTVEVVVHVTEGLDEKQRDTLVSALNNTNGITVAEFCPLRDEAFAYRDRLRDSGVPCDHLHYDDLIHAFLNLQDLVPDRCEHFYQQVSAFLNDKSE